MGARVRLDGSVVCAAMHPIEPGDTYIDDNELYELVISNNLVASDTHLHRAGCDGIDCEGTLISASGSPICGDGIWFRTQPFA